MIFDFSAFPGSADFVIEDDPGDEFTRNGTSQYDWQWTNFHTDGTAVGPLPAVPWSLTVTPTFNAPPATGRPDTFDSEIDFWKFLSGTTGTDVTILDMTKPITIRGAGSTQRWDPGTPSQSEGGSKPSRPRCVGPLSEMQPPGGARFRGAAVRSGKVGGGHRWWFEPTPAWPRAISTALLPEPRRGRSSPSSPACLRRSRF